MLANLYQSYKQIRCCARLIAKDFTSIMLSNLHFLLEMHADLNRNVQADSDSFAKHLPIEFAFRLIITLELLADVDVIVKSNGCRTSDCISNTGPFHMQITFKYRSYSPAHRNSFHNQMQPKKYSQNALIRH